MVLVYDLISVNKFVILSKVFLIHMMVARTHLHSLRNYRNRQCFFTTYGLPDKQYDHEYECRGLPTDCIYEVDA